jgi:hypothetical protein
MSERAGAVHLPPHHPLAHATGAIGHVLTHPVIDPGEEPLVDHEVAHAALEFHAGHFRVLGDLLDPALPAESRLSLIAADRLIWERIQREQRDAIEEAHLGTMAMLQELWMHRGFASLRHIRNLQEALVESRTENYIQNHFVGRVDFMALDPEDIAMLTEILGREAPRFTTFNRADLNTWINDPPQAALRNQLIDLCGQSPFGTRDGMTLLAYLFNHPEAVALLVAEHGAALGGDVDRIRAEVTTLEGHFTTAQRRQTALEDQVRTAKEHAENLQKAMNALEQVVDAESERLRALQAVEAADNLLRTLGTPTAATPPVVLNQFTMTTKERSDAQNQVNAAYRQSQTARRSYERFTGAPFACPTIAPSPSPTTGTLRRIGEVTAHLATLQPHFTTVSTTYHTAQSDYETNQRNWDASKDPAHPFNDTTDPPPGPLRAAGFENFQALQTQFNEARGRLSTAIRSQTNRRNTPDLLLSPAELLRRLAVRALRRDQPLLMDDEVAVRASVETATLLHLSRQQLDETATTRALTRTAIYDRIPGLNLWQRTRRAWNRRSDRHRHRSFDEFKEEVLAKDDRFKKIPMDEFTPETEIDEITEWVGEDDHSHLNPDQLWALKTVLEHAYKGQLHGGGQFEFDVDLRPLIQRVTTVYSTVRARQILNEQGATANHAAVLNGVLQSMASEPADIRHMGFLDRVSAKIDKFLNPFRARQAEAPEDSEGKANLARMESTLGHALQWGPTVADLALNLENLRQHWRNRRLTQKAVEIIGHSDSAASRAA